MTVLKHQLIWSKKTQMLMDGLLFVLSIICLIFLLIRQGEGETYTASLGVSFLLLSFFRHYEIYGKSFDFPSYLLPLLELVALGALYYMSKDMWVIVLFVILLIDITFLHGPIYGVVFGLLTVATYMTISFRLNYMLASPFVSVTLAIMALTILMVPLLVIRNYVLQNLILEEALLTLKVRMEEIETLIEEKERTRIAGEIHDSLGHKLTGALIQLEAAMMIIDKDPKKAKERVGNARIEVKEGIEDVRYSVRMIQEGRRILDFIPAIESLIMQTKKNYGIEITFDTKIESNLLPIESKTLFQSLQEAITNGVKHAGADYIHIALIENDEAVLLTVMNNGSIPQKIVMGFGLMQMKERLLALGGNLQTEVTEETFTLTLSIPKGKEIYD